MFSKRNKITLSVMCFLLTYPVCVSADTIFYCVSEKVVQVSTGEIEQYSDEKFKIKVSPEKIMFASDGYFGSAIFEKKHIHTFLSDDYWQVSSDWSVMTFDEGHFNYAMLRIGGHVTAIIATCDKF